VRASAGADGARQVHFAAPSPDGTYVVVANQNGKLLERIDADWSVPVQGFSAGSAPNTPAPAAC
jgi:hypothetical protein